MLTFRPYLFPHVGVQTKPLVAAGVMMLIERGLLHLDDPLSKYHPKFQ